MKTTLPKAELTKRGFPCIHAKVHNTAAGTRYLKEPGVIMVAKPDVDLEAMGPFLRGLKDDFEDYINDPVSIPSGEQVTKTGGQLCYLSFGTKRTDNAHAADYIRRIMESKHGSVLEHANFTFIFYGISRAVTHELVRHRAGFAYSQVSQRYVSGAMVRFVESLKYQKIPELHEMFIEDIDRAIGRYEQRAAILLKHQQAGNELLQGDRATDMRKLVNQEARAVLPNETEAPIQVTGNVRAWRHECEMRGITSEHADPQIRELGVRTMLCLKAAAPMLFQDFRFVKATDGRYGLENDFRKV